MLVSVASGKGGVGKSFVSLNLAMLLAEKGLKTALIDLDLGSGDLPTLLGLEELRAPHLGHFLLGHSNNLSSVRKTIRPNLDLYAATEETPYLVNPPFMLRQKLLKAIKSLNADVIILDLGAGTSTFVIDFFLESDVPLLVSVPEPTAVMDAIRFIKLCVQRRVLTALKNAKNERDELYKKYFVRWMDMLQELLMDDQKSNEEIYKIKDWRLRAQVLVESFEPRLVWNRVSPITKKWSTFRLKHELSNYGLCPFEDWAWIPETPKAQRSVLEFIPLVDADPNDSATNALKVLRDRVIEEWGNTVLSPSMNTRSALL